MVAFPKYWIDTNILQDVLRVDFELERKEGD